MRFIYHFSVRLINLRLRFVHVLGNLTNLSTRRSTLRFNVLLTRVIKIINNYRKGTNLPYGLSRLQRRDVVLFRAVILGLSVVISLTRRISVPRHYYFNTLVVTHRGDL